MKNLLAGLFQLLHTPGKQIRAEVIFAHLHTLLTEFNTAFAEQYQSAAVNQNAWLSKFSEFRIAVERYLTELHDVQGSAAKLALNPSSLYGIVKEFAGISPREWITNRLMLEARRRLQDSTTEVKKPAYDPGVSDPGYFSRLFRKHSGISVTKYPAEPRDLSRN